MIGTIVVTTAQIRHAKASVGVGNCEFQARQCRPPKTTPPKIDPNINGGPDLKSAPHSAEWIASLGIGTTWYS